MAAIEELSIEVDRAEVIAGVEQAAALAASQTAGKTLKVRLDPESGSLSCHVVKRVAAAVVDPDSEVRVEAAPEGSSPGDLIEVPAPLGISARRAVRAARAVLESRLGAARLLARAERYRGRVGKLETGVVARRDGGDLIVNLGPVEGRLPASEQSRHEVFNPEDTIRVAVRSIEPEDPPVILSRTAPEVLAGVIERETPEVRRGIVEVRAVARHPGVRAKVAVWSSAAGVDAVSACLGPGGARIRAVSRELRGERVDVVLWDPSMEAFARNALRPAEVLGVRPAEADASGPPRWGNSRPAGLIVTVSEAELPRALGKRGQNVRLAADLLGAPIEVVAEGQAPRERRAPARERGSVRRDGFRPRRGPSGPEHRRTRSPERGRQRRPGGGPGRGHRPRPADRREGGER